MLWLGQAMGAWRLPVCVQVQPQQAHETSEQLEDRLVSHHPDGDSIEVEPSPSQAVTFGLVLLPVGDPPNDGTSPSWHWTFVLGVDWKCVVRGVVPDVPIGPVGRRTNSEHPPGPMDLAALSGLDRHPVCAVGGYQRHMEGVPSALSSHLARHNVPGFLPPADVHLSPSHMSMSCP